MHPLLTSTTAPTAASPSPSPSSLAVASSVIKARLQQITSGSTYTSTPTSRSPSYVSAFSPSPTPSPFSGGQRERERERRRGRDASILGKPTPQSTNAQAQARASHLQAELKLQQLEISKLTAATVEARKERDVHKQRAQQLAEQRQYIAHHDRPPVSSPATASPAAPAADPPSMSSFFYESQIKELVAELERKSNELDDMKKRTDNKSGGDGTKPTTHTTNSKKTVALESELRMEVETLRYQVDLATSELRNQRVRADAAEERARFAESKNAAAISERQALEKEMHAMQQELHQRQHESKRLAIDVVLAQEKAALAEAKTEEERARRSRGGHNNTSKTNTASKQHVVAEAGLTAQVRALAAQLQASKSEAMAAKQQVAELTAQLNSQSATSQGVSATMLSQQRELECALSQAIENIEAKAREMEEVRQALARVGEENRRLHDAVQEQERQALQSTQLKAKLEATQREVKSATSHIAQLEDALAKANANGNGNGNAHSWAADSQARGEVHDERDALGTNNRRHHGPSPLRDVVGTLRAELHDRELRLAAAEEELGQERRRAAELHRQVLDQAVEIDDLMREGVREEGMEIKALREELERAQQRLAAATTMAAVPPPSSSSSSPHDNENDVEVLRNTISTLKEMVHARESEIMTLQGQVQVLLSSTKQTPKSRSGGGEERREKSLLYSDYYDDDGGENWLTGE